MSIALKMDVQGAKELEKALNELGDAALPTMRRALRNAAKPIADAAKIMAPTSPGGGELRNSIIIDVKPYRTDGGVYAKIGPASKSPAAHYAHLVESGTAPHSLAPKKRRLSRLFKKSRNANVMHPGARAQPFMRTAFDFNIGRAQEIIKKTIERKLARMRKGK